MVKKKQNNSDLYVKGVTDKTEDYFYGIIHLIDELDYLGRTKKISF